MELGTQHEVNVTNSKSVCSASFCEDASKAPISRVPTRRSATSCPSVLWFPLEFWILDFGSFRGLYLNGQADIIR